MAMNIYDYAEKKKTSVRQVLDFTLLSNPIGPSNRARSAMRAALKTAPLYPDSEARYLKRHIAKKECVGAENILFGHGSGTILELVFASVNPGKVLILAPLPGHYAPLLERHGADAVLFTPEPAGNPSHEARRLARLVDEADMIMAPNPHWTTGLPAPAETIRAMTERLGSSGKILILDECLSEFADCGHRADQAVQSANTLILRTFSLYYALSGLRLGYALGSRPLLDRIAGAFDVGPVSSVAVVGALASLKDKEFRKRTKELIETEKAYLIDRLHRVGGVSITDTPCNFLLVNMVWKAGATDLEEGFLRNGILVEVFRGEKGEPSLRLPVRGRRQNARFVKTLARMVYQSKPGRQEREEIP